MNKEDFLFLSNLKELKTTLSDLHIREKIEEILHDLEDFMEPGLIKSHLSPEEANQVLQELSAIDSSGMQ